MPKHRYNRLVFPRVAGWLVYALDQNTSIHITSPAAVHSLPVREENSGIMGSSRTAKPLVSALLALLFVLSFVLPFLQFDYLAGPITPFDEVQAGSIRWGVILAVALIWLGVQLFWKAPRQATKLGLAASATICWLSIALLYPFKDLSLDE